MAEATGITTQKDNQGNLEKIIIDVKKHPEALTVLRGAGLIEVSDLRKEVDAGGFMTVKECFDDVRASVTTLPWKK